MMFCSDFHEHARGAVHVQLGNGCPELIHNSLIRDVEVVIPEGHDVPMMSEVHVTASDHSRVRSCRE